MKDSYRKDVAFLKNIKKKVFQAFFAKRNKHAAEINRWNGTGPLVTAEERMEACGPLKSSLLTGTTCFDANPSFSSFGYFFVPGPLGHLKFVPKEVFRSNDSIDNVSINICGKSKSGKIFETGVLFR